MIAIIYISHKEASFLLSAADHMINVNYFCHQFPSPAGWLQQVSGSHDMHLMIDKTRSHEVTLVTIHVMNLTTDISSIGTTKSYLQICNIAILLIFSCVAITI